MEESKTTGVKVLVADQFSEDGIQELKKSGI
jgi:hypothetical protein